MAGQGVTALGEAGSGALEQISEMLGKRSSANVDAFAKQLDLRIESIGSPSLSKDLRTFKAAFQKVAGVMTDEVALQAAETLYALDHQARLRYDDRIVHPLDALRTSVAEKQADPEDKPIKLQNGTVWRTSQFSKVAASDLADAFGDSLMSHVLAGTKVDAEKLAEIAETFPKDEADVLDRLMLDASAEPEPQGVKIASAGVTTYLPRLNHMEGVAGVKQAGEEYLERPLKELMTDPTLRGMLARATEYGRKTASVQEPVEGRLTRMLAAASQP